MVEQKIEELQKELDAYKGMLKVTQKSQKNLRVILWNTIKSFNKNFNCKKTLEEMTSDEISIIIIRGLNNRAEKFNDLKREKALIHAKQILEPFIGLDISHWPKGLEQLLNILS